MASSVQLKRSAVQGAVPTTGQLNLGELAINTYDGKLYLKKNVSGTESIVEIGAGGGSGGASISIGATSPSSPSNGSLWWDSTYGLLKIYYNDGDSSQWVDAFSTLTVGSSGTVSSVDISVPTGLQVSGGPITSSGTLAITLDSAYSIPTTASQTNWDSAYTQRLQWDGSNTNLSAPTGRTSLGATTVGDNLFTLTNPSAITFLRVNADNTVSALDAPTFRTAIGAGDGNMLKATYDTNNDGIVDEASSVPWAGITDVPTVFPPDAHTQEISTINGLQTALDGKQPTGSYTTLMEVSSVTGDMMGFIDRTSTTLSFVEATRTFTISPTGSTWSVYNLGSLITVTGARSIVIPNTTGSHFIKLNPSTLVLESYIGIPQFATEIIMVYIYWNATTGKAVIVGDERHTSKRDTTWHSNQHLNVGTVWRSGGALGYTLNAPATVTLSLASPILIADEDLLHTITHAASPDGVNYQQILTTAASLEVIYLSGTDYTRNTASTSPWIAGTTTASYNSISGASGSLVDAGEGKYITYWVLATNDMRSPIKLVLGRQSHSTLDAAYAESFEEYGMSFAEQVFMYQVVVQTSTSFANTAKVQIAGVRKLLDRLASAASSYSAGAHGDLTGRDAASQHPISAITDLQTTLDGKQATLVSATNIKTINGNTILGSGDLVITGGSGSPGGTSGEVQYNDGAGGFAGALNVEIENGYLRLPDTGAQPSSPAASGLNLFSRTRGGRILPAWIGPSGLDTTMQPALFGNTTYMWLPGTGTTLGINWGTSFTARNSGTSAAQATPTKASTNAMTSMNRATFGTGTTATGASGVQSSATVAWRGNSSGLGGFFFFARFGIETLASDMRAFVGLSANNAAMAADANTWNNTIGIEKGTADSVWYVVQRGTANTRLSSGATVTAGQVLDMWMYTPPNGSTITVRLANAITGTVYIDNVVLNTTLPAATTFLYMQAHCQSVTGTTAKLLALNRLYCEVDL